jgi:hypothetical protein
MHFDFLTVSNSDADNVVRRTYVCTYVCIF